MPTITIVRAKPAVPPVEEVVIRLSAYEAGVLYRVVRHVGGKPAGPRRVTQSIHDALQPAFRDEDRGVRGSIFLEVV